MLEGCELVCWGIFREFSDWTLEDLLDLRDLMERLEFGCAGCWICSSYGCGCCCWSPPCLLTEQFEPCFRRTLSSFFEDRSQFSLDTLI